MPEDTAPTNRDFPLYVSCGAAPTSRKEESCRFCGAVLPWADFDLRSRRRLVLESVPESTMDTALERVEASGAFQGLPGPSGAPGRSGAGSVAGSGGTGSAGAPRRPRATTPAARGRSPRPSRRRRGWPSSRSRWSSWRSSRRP